MDLVFIVPPSQPCANDDLLAGLNKAQHEHLRRLVRKTTPIHCQPLSPHVPAQIKSTPPHGLLAFQH